MFIVCGYSTITHTASTSKACPEPVIWWPRNVTFCPSLGGFADFRVQTNLTPSNSARQKYPLASRENATMRPRPDASTVSVREKQSAQYRRGGHAVLRQEPHLEISSLALSSTSPVPWTRWRRPTCCVRARFPANRPAACPPRSAAEGRPRRSARCPSPRGGGPNR